MKPRRESKMARVLRWQHALLIVLLLCSLLYASLILHWTLRDPDTMQGRTAASMFQRNKQETEVSSNASEAEASVGRPLRGGERVGASAEPSDIVDFPSNISQTRRLRCIGWRATAGCSPSGSRVPEDDEDCDRSIPPGSSGYCEIEDLDSLERLMVMKRTCAETYRGASIRCSDAPGFANFRAKAQVAVDKALALGYALPNTNRTDPKLRQGIVIVAYPKLVASTYATVRALRDVLGCSLPIEIWLRPDEMNKVPGVLEPLWDLARNKSGGEITFQAIRHQHALQFNSKIYAIYHSKFEQVLFLDADNVPVRDPSYLFKTPEFMKTGAVFWPDFWHPDQTIFFINPSSLVWQLLDMPFVDMFEQESGQLLIDRKRHAAPLALVTFYAFHQPNYFRRLSLAWGDKDLYRFAWLKLGASFHMIQSPPAVAGELKENSFCGMTMAQHDPSGDVIFLHRNQLKLTGEGKLQDFDLRLKKALSTVPQNAAQANVLGDGYPDPAIWTHLVSFRDTSPRSHYTIERHASVNKFTGLQRCFGGRELHKNPHFYTQEFTDLSYAELEFHLRRFARTAAQLRQRKMSTAAT